MNDFLENTETFVKNINNSLIERGQWIDSFEILLDKLMDYQREERNADFSFSRLVSLLEVLIMSMKFSQSKDEDLVMIYEKRRLKEFKEHLLDNKDDD